MPDSIDNLPDADPNAALVDAIALLKSDHRKVEDLFFGSRQVSIEKGRRQPRAFR